MQIDIMKKYRVYFRKPVAIYPIAKRTGVCSKNYETDKHILLWDFDDTNFDFVELELNRLMRKYELPQIYILQSSENHYHAYCFASRTFQQVIHILSETKSLDFEYLRLGIVRGYYTLRFSDKENSKMRLMETLPSSFLEEMSMDDVTINEYFTTNIGGE